MKNTKNIIAALLILIMLSVGNVLANDDDESTASGLDLHAVGELFKESENLEHFEKSLNAPETGINNLDLDKNDEIDYIRVEEQVEGDTHLIVLQTQFAEDDFQDVATIAVEKENENYEMQIQGDSEIYGANYYVVPAVNIGTWSVVRWIYRPAYRPYRSVFGWRVFPNWWRVRRPVTINVYRTRTVNYVGKRNFVATKTVKVKSVTKVNYRPRTSTTVTKKRVVATNGNKTVVKSGVKKTTNTRNGTKTKTKVRVKKTRN